jgi:dCMP deaminase
MLIISCGIKKVVAEKKYHAGAESEVMFKNAGVELTYFDETIEQYSKQ